MKSISTYVESELLLDSVAFDALRRGLLNYSQYAEELLPRIEAKRLESVSSGSIITALSRLATKYKGQETIEQDLQFDQISLYQGLEEVTYALGTLEPEVLKHIYTAHESSDKFFELTVGKNELTCIASSELMKQIGGATGATRPLVHVTDLIGITFRFGVHYFDQPAVLYNILRVFALEHISIIEFVSTYREATVILKGSDRDIAFQTMRRFFHAPGSATID